MGDEEPGHGASNGRLGVFCRSSAAVEPGEGPFDRAAAGKEFNALCRMGAVDDFERPRSEFANFIVCVVTTKESQLTEIHHPTFFQSDSKLK
jgi:hypothetical protein